MKLEIELNYTDEGETIEDAIVNHAASRLLHEARESTHALGQRIKAITDDMIREHLTPIIEEALAKGFQPVNHYGEPKGEPVTMRELISQKATAALTAKSKDSWGSTRDKPPLIHELLNDRVERVLKRDLQKEIDAAKKQVQAIVKSKGAEVIEETISRMAR